MKRLWLVAAIISVIVVSQAPRAHADVNDFVVTGFAAEYSLDRSDPQGLLTVRERISVDFSSNNHGILRALPNSFQSPVTIRDVSSDSGAPAQYSTYGSNGNKVLKIGDPKRTVSGNQEYNITYTVANVVRFYNDHDELYWDINGDQWQQQFNTVGVTVQLPRDLTQDTQQARCFTGNYGTTTQDCFISQQGSVVKATASRVLTAGQTLTIVTSFSKGYFHPATWRDHVRDYVSYYWLSWLKFLLLPLVVGTGSFIWWRKRGRDAPGSGTIIPQYDAPDNLTPIAVGTLMDFKVDNRDISATVIDLALRKYLKIIETKTEHKLRKDELSYQLQLLNTDFSGLKTYERLLLEGLFPSPEQNAIVDVTASKNKLYQTAKSMRTDVEQALTTLGYFRANPLQAGRSLTIVGFGLLGLVYLFGVKVGAALGFGAGVAALCALGVAHYLPSRTSKGVTAKEHVMGLKLYLETAEKDRLELLQGPNARYAEQPPEPTKTVDLFEKLLPYAIVLGVEQQWAKQFEGLYMQPPDWYAGNWTAFNAGVFAGNLSGSFQGAFNGAFAAPASSGSSGFGGGGFSGGGGGGGGGGGW